MNNLCILAILSHDCNIKHTCILVYNIQSHWILITSDMQLTGGTEASLWQTEYLVQGSYGMTNVSGVIQLKFVPMPDYLYM